MRILKIILKVIACGVLALVGAVWLFLVTPYEVADEPTPLMKAALSGDVAQTRQLLAQGANVNERRKCLTRYGIFIAHGPSTPYCDDTALMAALERRNTEIMQMLLDAGADTSARDNHNRGVWEYATASLSEQSVDTIYLLAERTAVSPADVDGLLYRVGDLRDQRLLEFALSKPHSSAAREGALCGAVRRGDIEMMTRLLDTFETVPAKTLYCALNVPFGLRRPSVELLLDRGADPNGDPESGNCPLSFVILGMMPGSGAQTVPPEVQDLLELLLQRGADPRLAQSGGPNAIAIARHHGHEAVAAMLENWRPKDKRLAE